MTQAPAPGPLTSESVKLLVKGDLLRVIEAGSFLLRRGLVDGGVATVRSVDGPYIDVYGPAERSDNRASRFAFIGRPDADGWIPWSGGENPVPGQMVEVKFEGGIVSEVLDSECFGWDRHKDPVVASLYDIIAFRLAPAAPVEASGSELHPATADLVDRFAAELKSKLAKAESKYGYRDEWLKPDWQDELTKSLAEHTQKGDPRDVAAYCAFAWHHEWSTSDAAGYFAPALRPQPSGETREDDLRTACQAVLDDYQTSDAHHPHHVLIRRTDFECIKALVEAPVSARAEADRVRIAVEALEATKNRVREWPIDDQETCMCGSPVSGHGMGDGHSPVSQGDHAISMIVKAIDEAIAALKSTAAKEGSS